MEDAESLAALDRLCGLHRSAVVTEDPSWHFALLESLTEAVDELLGVLSVQVPLRVAAHARAVVECAKEIGCLALPGRREHLPLAHVIVVVPEGIDVCDLVGARLPRDDLRLAALAAASRVLEHPAVLHETAHRRVPGHRAERRVLLDPHTEVVVMELVAPARVLVVLRGEHPRERLRDARVRARVARHFALLRAERVGLAARRVVHPLDRLGRVAQHPARRRMAPRRRSEHGDAARELAHLRR